MTLKSCFLVMLEMYFLFREGKCSSSGLWTLSKHTLAIASGSIGETATFVSKYLCAEKTHCLSDLGCNNWRAWCILRAPYFSAEWQGTRAFELHWVDAGNLNDIKNKKNFSELDEFIRHWQGHQPILQNKLQLFTRNTTAWVNPLRMAGIKIDVHSSLDSNGDRACHFGFALTGRIYEFIGRCSTYGMKDEKSWPSCPSAQRLLGTLNELEALEVLDDDATNDDNYFRDARDSNPLIVVGIASATSNLLQFEPLAHHLSLVSGASIQRKKYQQCQVLSVTWDSMPNLVVRYIEDPYSPDFHQTKLFDAFVMREHSAFYSETYDSWDRLLDQHLGLWYSGHDNLTCEILHTSLLEANISIAARIEPDALELYCGYPGPLTWEYQFENARCRTFHLSNLNTECACSPKNNFADFLRNNPKLTTCLNYTIGDDDSLPTDCGSAPYSSFVPKLSSK